MIITNIMRKINAITTANEFMSLLQISRIALV